MNNIERMPHTFNDEEYSSIPRGTIHPKCAINPTRQSLTNTIDSTDHDEANEPREMVEMMRRRSAMTFIEGTSSTNDGSNDSLRYTTKNYAGTVGKKSLKDLFADLEVDTGAIRYRRRSLNRRSALSTLSHPPFDSLDCEDSIDSPPLISPAESCRAQKKESEPLLTSALSTLRYPSVDSLDCEDSNDYPPLVSPAESCHAQKKESETLLRSALSTLRHPPFDLLDCEDSNDYPPLVSPAESCYAQKKESEPFLTTEKEVLIMKSLNRLRYEKEKARIAEQKSKDSGERRSDLVLPTQVSANRQLTEGKKPKSFISLHFNKRPFRRVGNSLLSINQKQDSLCKVSSTTEPQQNKRRNSVLSLDSSLSLAPISQRLRQTASFLGMRKSMWFMDQKETPPHGVSLPTKPPRRVSSPTKHKVSLPTKHRVSLPTKLDENQWRLSMLSMESMSKCLRRRASSLGISPKQDADEDWRVEGERRKPKSFISMQILKSVSPKVGNSMWLDEKQPENPRRSSFSTDSQQSNRRNSIIPLEPISQQLRRLSNLDTGNSIEVMDQKREYLIRGKSLNSYHNMNQRRGSTHSTGSISECLLRTKSFLSLSPAQEGKYNRRKQRGVVNVLRKSMKRDDRENLQNVLSQDSDCSSKNSSSSCSDSE
jgi:hypothetical protein